MSVTAENRNNLSICEQENALKLCYIHTLQYDTAVIENDVDWLHDKNLRTAVFKKYRKGWQFSGCYVLCDTNNIKCNIKWNSYDYRQKEKCTLWMKGICDKFNMVLCWL